MIYHTTLGRSFEPGSAYGTFRDLGEAVSRAAKTLRPRKDDFDFIAVQGVSGMSLGFPLALVLDKPIVVVRKEFETEDENSHSRDRVCGISYEQDHTINGKRGLFIDDFVSMGETRARVRMGVEAEGGKLVAQYMSRENDYLLL